MRKSQKWFLATLLISIIVLLATSTYIYLKNTTSKAVSLNNRNTSTYTESTTSANTTLPTPEKQKTPATPEQKNFQLPQKTYDENKISECIKGYQSTYPHKEAYSAGYVFILFQQPISLDVAMKTIKSYELSAEKPINLFENYPSLHVKVKAGEEFLWSCRLKQDNRIKYAEPSPIATTATL